MGMRCPGCNAENQPAAKFCVECGTAFQNACVKCSFENPPAAKFCQECGASLKPARSAQPPQVSASTSSQKPPMYEGLSTEPGDVPDGERKTVTALFADIKASTELMADLDLEQARTIIDPALRLMIEAVHRYDGYIVQHSLHEMGRD
jgi:adenylate cyclase